MQKHNVPSKNIILVTVLWRRLRKRLCTALDPLPTAGGLHLQTPMGWSPPPTGARTEAPQNENPSWTSFGAASVGFLKLMCAIWGLKSCQKCCCCWYVVKRENGALAAARAQVAESKPDQRQATNRFWKTGLTKCDNNVVSHRSA